MRRRRLWVGMLAAAAAALAAEADVRAQAWVPPKGEASLSGAGQYLNARYHLLFDGSRDDRGRMEWVHAISDLTYGVSDRFAVRVGIPYVVSRYTGDFPHRPVGRPANDDGAWHATFQDLTFEARYQAITGPIAVTPFLGAGIPAAAYEQHSHAAAGRHLREASAGVNIGRRLDPFLPDAFVHAKLSFTVPERVLGIWHNRNNADVEVGHFLTPSVGVRLLGSWQWTHGGFRIPIDDRPPGSTQFFVHDQLSKDTHFIAGVGLSVAATGSVDVSATAFRVMSGENSNLVTGINVGATWSFSPTRLLRGRKGPAPRRGPRPT